MNKLNAGLWLNLKSTLILIVATNSVFAAETLHYWRFTPGSEFFIDSVGGLRLEPPADDGQGIPISEFPLPSENRGQYFPTAVEDLAPNTGAVELLRNSVGLVSSRSTPVSDDFTIELFTHIDELVVGGGTLGADLAGQITQVGNTSAMSWSIKAWMNHNAVRPQELSFVFSDGANLHWPSANVLVDPQRDYYIAGAFDLDAKEVTYYAYDLANNSLEISTVPHSLTKLNPDPTMTVGGDSCQCFFTDGIIDEVRLSRGIVPFEELLMNKVSFADSSLGTPTEVISAARGLYSTDGTTARDRRSRTFSTIEVDQRLITKFDLPQFTDAEERLETAVLRVFVDRAVDAELAQLSLWHSATDNDQEMEPTDYDDLGYIDTAKTISGEVVDAYYDIDVTDLVLDDYRQDVGDAVAAFRLQTSGDAKYYISLPERYLERPQLLLSFKQVSVATAGDFNLDGLLTVADIDDLAAAITNQRDDFRFDLNGDRTIDDADHMYWVAELKQTWVGDANLDGEFNSSDLINVLAAGTYESDVDAGWGSGDFDGSGRFDSGDLTFALADGGYEAGLREAVVAVPEPSTMMLLMASLILLVTRATTRRNRG